jgi:hypothetical protein
MEQATARAIIHEYDGGEIHSRAPKEATSSAVSWAAVFAGSSVTAATCLILLSLGTGLGLASVSVWSNVGVSASTLGIAAILWMILMQIMSSSIGGYLAGRLRTKWTSIHSDEVYFRDTAHGFLTWAVSLVVTAVFLGSAGASMVGMAAASGDQPGMALAANNRQGVGSYFADSLLRSDSPGSKSNTEALRNEASVILANGLQHGAVSAEDLSYLGRIVMERTGLNREAADKRVSDVYAKAKQAAESIRKATAHLLLWTFVSLLIGAFCASFAATIGGKQRDRMAGAA